MKDDDKDYIRLHRHERVDALALKRAPEGVDHKYCLQQIEGWQTACRKLPQWAATEGIVYPPALSMEQCSSEAAAHYKRRLAERLVPPERRRVMADLTGGLGVDFCQLAPLFAEAHYMERLPHLCAMARHNLPLLGAAHATVHEGECDRLLAHVLPPDGADLIFADPARRDANGRRTVWLEHCTPDITLLLPRLMERTDCLMLKLSPMIDIAHTVRQLGGRVSEVHTVCVEGECKELLLVVRRKTQAAVDYHCAELGRRPYIFTATPSGTHAPLAPNGPEDYLYEPGAGLLKAGVQDEVCRRWPLRKLHPNSHLYTGGQLLADFPGRAFCTVGLYDFSKQDVKRLRQALPQANLTVRNFPATVDELRRRLKLREGGNDYLFATTLADGRRVMVHCRKITT